MATPFTTVPPFDRFIDVPVVGGDLRVALSGAEVDAGAPVVLLVHGITGSHRSWTAIAEVLGEEVALVAPDLRGRGGSNTLGKPYGISSHVADLIAVLDLLGVGSATLVGHSMGGYVVARMAADHPGRGASVVLVDGGLRLPVPEGIEPDVLLAAVLGPALARLVRSFASREAYAEFWRAHPAFRRPGAWTDHVAAYADYDLEGAEPQLRSRVREEAVRVDGRQLLVDPATHSAILEVQCPILLLRAPRGLLDEEPPLIPEAVVDSHRQNLVNLVHELVPDTNHYLITLGDREAALVADRLREAVKSS